MHKTYKKLYNKVIMPKICNKEIIQKYVKILYKKESMQIKLYKK